MLLAVLLSGTLYACEKIAPFKIINYTSETISVVITYTQTNYTSGEGLKPVCEIKPGETCQPNDLFADVFNTYLVEARDPAGNVVFLSCSATRN